MTTRFALEQWIAAPPDAVAGAFVDAGFYAMLGALPNLGAPSVLSRDESGGRVRLRVRYRFTGQLNAAARAVLDPARLTWVDESEHDLAARRVTFRLLPDNYADRLRCHGGYRLEPEGDGTRRRAEGELTVARTPLVGGAVERAIVSGLEAHFAAEVAVVEEWLANPDSL